MAAKKNTESKVSKAQREGNNWVASLPNLADAQKSGKTAKARQNGSQTKETPYREGSCYQNIIEALTKLGLGRIHGWDKIVSAVELPRGFKSKEKRNDETGKGWRDRVIQNVRVLGRNDYGKACRKVLRMEVRCEGKQGAGLFNLGK